MILITIHTAQPFPQQPPTPIFLETLLAFATPAFFRVKPNLRALFNRNNDHRLIRKDALVKGPRGETIPSQMSRNRLLNRREEEQRETLSDLGRRP